MMITIPLAFEGDVGGLDGDLREEPCNDDLELRLLPPSSSSSLSSLSSSSSSFLQTRLSR